MPHHKSLQYNKKGCLVFNNSTAVSYASTKYFASGHAGTVRRTTRNDKDSSNSVHISRDTADNIILRKQGNDWEVHVLCPQMTTLKQDHWLVCGHSAGDVGSWRMAKKRVAGGQLVFTYSSMRHNFSGDISTVGARGACTGVMLESMAL